MNKKVFKQIDVTCVFQNTNPDFVNIGTSGTLETTETSTKVVCGMLTPTKEGFLFQETVPHKREIRNNRLFEGTLTNLVLRKDGLYHPFVKGYKPGGQLSKQDYAYRVFCEITEALNSLE